MIEIVDKISVIVDGVLEKEFNCMLDALAYVHNECCGHKVQFKTEKVYKVFR